MRNNQLKNIKNSKGFTLLEVLVALAIIAISFTAVLRAEVINIHDVSYIQDKTIANFVGENVIYSIQLKLTPTSMPGLIHDQTTMLGKTWYWTADINTTENEAVDSIKVTVSPDQNADPIATVYGSVAIVKTET